VTISGTGTIKYTVDGSNPKTSSTAQVYSGAITVDEKTKVRAYAEQAGKLNSAIASADATV
jgi:hypothetical protein